MGRAILAVVLAYLTMFAVVFILLTGSYFALGADRAFQPGTYDLTAAWLAVWAVVTIVAAVLGGLVCASVARTKTPVTVLIALVLVLGIIQAVGVALAPKPTPEQLVRAESTDNFEAMTKARSPLWVAIANPIIGAAGVLTGARLVKKRSDPQ